MHSCDRKIRKMANKREKLREKILHIWMENPSLTFAEIGRQGDTSRATARNIILKYKSEKTIKHKPGAGRPSGFTDKKLVRNVVRSWSRNPNLLERDIARKHNTSQFTAHKIKVKRGLKTFKKIKVPNRSEETNKKAKTNCRRLYDQVLTKSRGCIIMDDETYVKSDFHQLPGQEYYVARNRGGVNKIFKVKKLSKFAKKILIWQAICSCGGRSDFFVVSGTLNKEIYIKKCLTKRLLPFYKKHKSQALFWPDLASCHYAKDTLNWYKRNGVLYVTKEQNPPNCPFLRPIERYWALAKRNLRKYCRPAKKLENVKKNWKKATDMIGEAGVQRLMRRVKSKARLFFRNSIED